MSQAAERRWNDVLVNTRARNVKSNIMRVCVPGVSKESDSEWLLPGEQAVSDGV